MSSVPVLKFIGDFKKLNQFGYTFGKVYAKNYKYYTKELTIDSDIIIWAKQKDVNIMGMNSTYCACILQIILDENFKLDKYHRFVIDKDNMSFHELDDKLHDPFSYHNVMVDPLSGEQVKEMYRKFDRVFVYKEWIKELKYLYDNKLIEIKYIGE